MRFVSNSLPARSGQDKVAAFAPGGVLTGRCTWRCSAGNGKSTPPQVRFADGAYAVLPFRKSGSVVEWGIQSGWSLREDVPSVLALSDMRGRSRRRRGGCSWLCARTYRIRETADHGLTNRSSGRVRDKVPSSTPACAPLSSTVRRRIKRMLTISVRFKVAGHTEWREVPVEPSAYFWHDSDYPNSAWNVGSEPQHNCVAEILPLSSEEVLEEAVTLVLDKEAGDFKQCAYHFWGTREDWVCLVTSRIGATISKELIFSRQRSLYAKLLAGTASRPR